MRNLFVAIILAISVGCGGGDDDGGGGNADAAIDAPSTGSGLATPATITMTSGAGGGDVRAAVCIRDVGGTTEYTLEADWECTGGDYYISFWFNSGGGIYSVISGFYLLEPVTDVDIVSSSHGTLVTDGGGSDEIRAVPENTDVTVSTTDFTLTFRFAGQDISISAWDAR